MTEITCISKDASQARSSLSYLKPSNPNDQLISNEGASTTVNVLDSQRNCSIEQLEKRIYEHLLHCVRTETADQVLQRFQTLFVQGGPYPEAYVRTALHDLVGHSDAKHNFLPFFNRCCFIVINRWQMNPLYREKIVQFVDMLHQCRGPSVIVGQPSRAGRLRFLIQEYVRSQYFQKIRQLAEFLNPKNDQDERRPLSSLLYRYPYLYSHCLSNKDEGEDYNNMIAAAQQNARKQFDNNLSNYLTHTLIRPQQIHAEKKIIPIDNPTLLSHKELCSTLKHYIAKVDSRGTYKDMAHQFWTPGNKPQVYSQFKDALHDYVTSSVPSKFGQCHFNRQLKIYLNNLYPEQDLVAVNDFLTVRTCNQLLNFMVVESRQQPNHSIFMDLLNNLGSTVTVGLLLKVVLLCNKVKPHLERRFSLLFQHYEAHTRGSVSWLVACFEKLNLAWSAHYGTHNLSYVHLL